MRLRLHSRQYTRGISRLLRDDELEKVRELASIHSPDIEIAHQLDFSLANWTTYKVEHPEIQDLIDKSRAVGAEQLRKAQFLAALHGNVTMQIWLGRAILRQNEEVYVSTDTPLQLGDISPESKAHLIELRDAIYKTPQEVETEVLTVLNEEQRESSQNGQGGQETTDNETGRLETDS